MSTVFFSRIQLMDSRLEAKYLRLEKTRNRLLDELEGLDDDLLNTSLEEGKWSVNQVLAHLVMVEQVTAGFIERRIQKEEQLITSPLLNLIRASLLKVALLSGIKFKAPEEVAYPPAKSQLSSLRHEWDKARFRLEDLLTDFPAPLLDTYIFRHRHAGPLTIYQSLSFLQDHFNHHLRQIKNLKQQLVR